MGPGGPSSHTNVPQGRGRVYGQNSRGESRYGDGDQASDSPYYESRRDVGARYRDQYSDSGGSDESSTHNYQSHQDYVKGNHHYYDDPYYQTAESDEREFIGLDSLHGSFDDPEPRRGTRTARHRRRRQHKRDRRRSMTALTMVAIVFMTLAAGGWWGYGKIRDFLMPPDYPGEGSGAVTITIHQGDSATDIGGELLTKKVVKSVKAFVKAAESEPLSRELQPGTYQLRRQMNASAALKLLLDPASRIDESVTIPEGLSVKQILKRISDKTGIALSELEKAAEDPHALGVPSWSPNQVEGFLFPDTYQFQPKADAKTVLKQMIQRALQEFEQLNFVKHAQDHGLEPYQALIVASLVEGEGIPSDFKKIAQVVYNRLKEDMVLQFDSTTQYWLEKTGQDRKKRLTNQELRNPNNNYSTTLNKGLPPTAIANPGRQALEAAMEPEAGPWLYFVLVDTDGHSAFAVEENEHERNVQVCREKNLGC